MITKKEVDDLAYAIIGYAIDVHKELGPGLLESVYEKCLAHLLILNGYDVRTQQRIPIIFKGLVVDCDLRYDMLVNDLVIVELKSTDLISGINKAQLLTYLKLQRRPKGLIINFNVCNLAKEGVKSMVSEFYDEL